jgi:outer membrane protein assembly factor BamB
MAGGFGWSSPVRAVLVGVPQILTFNDSLAAHDELTGRVLWRSPWSGSYPRVSLPLVLPGDRVLLSTGYGVGAELLQVTQETNRWRATRVWKSLRMKSKFGSFFVIDGFLYGLDDGALACVDMADGALKWKGDRYGHGQMMQVGGLLLLMAESGDIVLLEPSPIEQRELTRFKVFTAQTWNPPALAGDLLVVRNDREAACLRLPTVARSAN